MAPPLPTLQGRTIPSLPCGSETVEWGKQAGSQEKLCHSQVPDQDSCPLKFSDCVYPGAPPPDTSPEFEVYCVEDTMKGAGLRAAALLLAAFACLVTTGLGQVQVIRLKPASSAGSPLPPQSWAVIIDARIYLCWRYWALWPKCASEARCSGSVPAPFSTVQQPRFRLYRWTKNL
jgi:hypothetical protein